MPNKQPLIFDGYHGDSISSFHDMKNAGIVLTIFKACQGTSDDSAYEGFVDRALSIDLLVGAYHFATKGNGKSQAQHFLKKLRPGMLMALDFEETGGTHMSVAEAENFVQEIVDQTGHLPALYYGHLLLEIEKEGGVGADSILRQCPAWISRYGNTQPKPIANQDMVMWQYTGDGVGPKPHRIAGCDNDADLSVWIGNPDDIPAFVAKHSFLAKS